MDDKKVESDRYGPQRKYMANSFNQGLTRVTVWIPKKDREELIKFASDLRCKK